MFRHILVPIDGSALSGMAVKMAVAIAKESNSRLTFFFAEPDKSTSLLDCDAALLRTFNPETLSNSINQHIREILGKAQAVANIEGVACELSSSISNDPFEAIIAAAEKGECDLILMASNGHRGVKGLLLGSQTQKVLVHSKIPVLVYR